MPLFAYECAECRKTGEFLIRGDESPECSFCGSKRMERQMSRFAPLSGGSSAPEPVGCGMQQCCQMQGGCMN